MLFKTHIGKYIFYLVYSIFLDTKLAFFWGESESCQIESVVSRQGAN